MQALRASRLCGLPWFGFWLWRRCALLYRGFNLQTLPQIDAASKFGRAAVFVRRADYKSAIQQIENLRYGYFTRREIPVSGRTSQIWPRRFNSAFVSRLGCKLWQ